MSKYVIKNCPEIYGIFLDGCKKDHYEDGTVLCQDCTDCLLKRIAVMANQAKHGAKAAGHFNFLADKILQNLDIEEVE